MDFVLHQAALPSVPRSIENPILTNEINAGGTLNILWAALSAKVKRLVYASSSSVYGDNTELPKREDMRCMPISPYGISKLVGEQYCQIFDRLYGLPTVRLRYFNVFGPRQDPLSEYAAAIPHFITKTIRGEPPMIFGDGEQSRDFTFVANVVEANILAAEASGISGEVFNIACGQRITVNSLVHRIREDLGSKVNPRHGDPRPGEILHSYADIAKAERLLNYRVLYPLDDGLQKTVAWYKERF
jgi:UDP-glucose 4-epimerase